MNVTSQLPSLPSCNSVGNDSPYKVTPNTIISNLSEPYLLSSGSIDSSLRIILVGDSSVGKTCILLRYTKENYTQTLGCTVGMGGGRRETGERKG